MANNAVTNTYNTKRHHYKPLGKLGRLFLQNKAVSLLAMALCCCLIFNLVLVYANASAPAVEASMQIQQSEPVVDERAVTLAAMQDAQQPILKPMQTLKNKPAAYSFEEAVQAAYAGYSDHADNSPTTSTYSGTSRYLQIPNSYISTPIAQGSDNSFYLNHNYYGGYDWRGCVYAHYRCNLSSISSLSQNTVLFGHNKTTNRYGGEVSNFSTLPRFQDYSFAANHRFIYLSIGGKTATFVVFAALDTEVRNEGSFPYWYPSISQSVINAAMNRSYWNYGVSVSTGDKLITLSTCSYDWGYDSNYNTYAKFVVMARMLRAGESTSSFGGISANSGRRTPAGLVRVQS